MPTENTATAGARTHNPGPWFAIEGCTGYRNEWLVDSSDGKSVCSLWRDDAKTNEANARLIAAAPALAQQHDELAAELATALDILGRISRAHDSGNNGAYMGEANLCPTFADMAREFVQKHGGHVCPRFNTGGQS